MVTVAQSMALKRIEQIITEIRSYLSRQALDEDLEMMFESTVEEVQNIVKEHGLDKQHAESFYERVVKAILAQAEKDEAFAWAADFAKKYMKE